MSTKYSNNPAKCILFPRDRYRVALTWLPEDTLISYGRQPNELGMISSCYTAVNHIVALYEGSTYEENDKEFSKLRPCDATTTQCAAQIDTIKHVTASH